jgi:hypothetical protein
MENLKLLIPKIEKSKTYYLRDTKRDFIKRVTGEDITIKLKFLGTDGSGIYSHRIYCEVDGEYELSDVCEEDGTLLKPVERESAYCVLRWYNRVTHEWIHRQVRDDYHFNYNLYYCKNYQVTSCGSLMNDDMAEYNEYEWSWKSMDFNCCIDSGIMPNDNLYQSESDVRFYCRCPSVSSLSLASHFCVNDGDAQVIQTKVQDLLDYLDSRGITMVYDEEEGDICFYNKSEHLPKGYTIDNDDSTNGHPKSVRAPKSALLKVKGFSMSYVNCDWGLNLNYTEPKKEEK